jgi:2-keto-4-pentenoate hydratase/2-oxohepta-3-ene-1,7-dioic acid hydratase in catechol pathway
MRFVAISTPDGERLGRVTETGTVDLLDTTLGLADLLLAGEDPTKLASSGDTVAYDEGQLSPPVRPSKIVCIGLNYLEHVKESGAQLPKAPLVFAKFLDTLTGPRSPIRVRRSVTDQVDWEAELAVVIGERMNNVPVERALDYVFGYTVANDVSGRDAQLGDVQWVRGKSFDTFCPIGPAIVTPDEIADPMNLGIWCRVNGEQVQAGNTGDMVFGIKELLSYCSASFTLQPGDLLLTGTPWGVGVAMKPQRFLKDGDVLETEVEGLGKLVNRVVDGY